MRIVVRHGHIAYYPRDREEVLHFRRIFKMALVAEHDYFTFAGLAGVPNWSQVGLDFGGLPAVVNYVGPHASDVMRANGFVYSMSDEVMVPIARYAGNRINFKQSRDTLLSPRPFVQPGVLVSIDSTLRGTLLSYSGELNIDEQRLSIDSVEIGPATLEPWSMPKVMPATCEAQVVTCNDLPLPGAVILSQGVGQSSGIAVLDGDSAHYVANISGDLKTLLTKVIDSLAQVKTALDKSVDALTAIDTAGYILTVNPGTGGASGVAAAPVATADISSITSAANEIDSLKSQLSDLNGALK